MVNLSGFLMSPLQGGTMSDNSLMYAFILFLRRLSISLWFSLNIKYGGVNNRILVDGYANIFMEITTMRADPLTPNLWSIGNFYFLLKESKRTNL